MAKKQDPRLKHKLFGLADIIFNELQIEAKNRLNNQPVRAARSESFNKAIINILSTKRDPLPRNFVAIDMTTGKILDETELKDRKTAIRSETNKILDIIYMDYNRFDNEIIKKLDLTNENQALTRINDGKIGVTKLQQMNTSVYGSGGNSEVTPYEIEIKKISADNLITIQSANLPSIGFIEDWFKKTLIDENPKYNVSIAVNGRKNIGIQVQIVGTNRVYLYYKIVHGEYSPITIDSRDNKVIYTSDASKFVYDKDTVKYDTTTQAGYANYRLDNIPDNAGRDIGHYKFSEAGKNVTFVITEYKKVKQELMRLLETASTIGDKQAYDTYQSMLDALDKELEDQIKYEKLMQAVTSIPFTFKASGTPGRKEKLLEVAQNTINQTGKAEFVFISESNAVLKQDSIQIHQIIRSLMDEATFALFLDDIDTVNAGARGGTEKEIKNAFEAEVLRARSAAPLTTLVMLSLVKLTEAMGLETLKKELLGKVKQTVRTKKKTKFSVELFKTKKVKLPPRKSRLSNIKPPKLKTPKLKTSPIKKSTPQKEFTELNTQFNVLQLNDHITEAVKSVMKKPALENDTGVFANSVRILGYDEKLKIIKAFYEPDPYHLFSINSGKSRAKTSIEQDPIRIINNAVKSMRSRWEPYLGSGVKVERG